MRDSGDPGIVITNLPRSNVEVLIFAYKTCQKAPIFNFEAVFNKYTRFKLNQQKTVGATIADMSRQTFLKIFLDLVN